MLAQKINKTFHILVEKDSERRLKMNNRPPPFYRNHDDPSSRALVVQLHYAVQYNDRQVVQDILNSRVPLDVKNEVHGNAAIHFAAKNYEHDYEVMELLISRGADVNMLNKYDNTPLHLVLVRDNCNPKVIQLLVECGADVNKFNVSNSSALHFAVQSSNCKVEVLDLLLSSGAEIDAVNCVGDTPLLRALRNPNCTQDVICWFVEHGANIEVTNNHGGSVLHAAAENRHFNLGILKWLLEKKVQLDLLNSFGKSPLYRAIENRCSPYMIHALLDAGATIDFGNPTVEKAIEICESVWDELSTANLELLLRYAFLRSLDYDMDRYITSPDPGFVSLVNFKNNCRREVQMMNTREILPGATFRDFLTGQRLLRFNTSATEGELCDIGRIFHCMAVDQYPTYMPIISYKLDIKDVCNNLRIYSMESKTVFLDCHSVAHIVGYLSTDDVLNSMIGFHSAQVCDECITEYQMIE